MDGTYLNALMMAHHPELIVIRDSPNARHLSFPLLPSLSFLGESHETCTEKSFPAAFGADGEDGDVKYHPAPFPVFLARKPPLQRPPSYILHSYGADGLDSS